ncbi:hypothetical protein E2C01_094882 [Portunus trituberculatus]|uniref:Uncharacterized protein n=1 Tax=Portunus trituberculatus TaxID=210409 RepID=A0A5B7K2V5_PORTR|nr:hypothetical protein [Portunus trituberculatus]
MNVADNTFLLRCWMKERARRPRRSLTLGQTAAPLSLTPGHTSQCPPPPNSSTTPLLASLTPLSSLPPRSSLPQLLSCHLPLLPFSLLLPLPLPLSCLRRHSPLLPLLPSYHQQQPPNPHHQFSHPLLTFPLLLHGHACRASPTLASSPTVLSCHPSCPLPPCPPPPCPMSPCHTLPQHCSTPPHSPTLESCHPPHPCHTPMSYHPPPPCHSRQP